ncbi:MAG: hypothetical protein ACYC7D_15560 [Nitrososphaerales archaeon]
MSPGANKMAGAALLVILAILLELTSPYSPDPILQLVVSLALAIAGALVAIRGVVDFLSERF